TLGKFSEDDFLPAPTNLFGLTDNPDIKSIDTSRFNIEVDDADTLTLHRKGMSGFLSDPIQIRLAGIDAPETTAHENDPLEDVRIFQEQAHGKKSSDYLRSKLEGGDVSLHIDTGRRTYDRYLGVLEADGVNLNLDLVKEGMVSALPFGDASEDIVNRSVVGSLENQAFKDRKGMWALKRYQALHEVNEGITRPLT